MRWRVSRQDIMTNEYPLPICSHQSTMPNMSSETSSTMMFWGIRSPWVNTSIFGWLSFQNRVQHFIRRWEQDIRVRKLGTASLSLNRLFRSAKDSPVQGLGKLNVNLKEWSLSTTFRSCCAVFWRDVGCIHWQKVTASSPLPDNDIHDKIVFETACGPCGRESLGSTEYGRIGI